MITTALNENIIENMLEPLHMPLYLSIVLIMKIQVFQLIIMKVDNVKQN